MNGVCWFAVLGNGDLSCVMLQSGVNKNASSWEKERFDGLCTRLSAVFCWCSVLRSLYEMTAWGIVTRLMIALGRRWVVVLYFCWLREEVRRCKDSSLYRLLANRWRNEGIS